jgi:hypothetical protein
MEAFASPKADGVYKPVGDPNTNRLPNNYDLEDPTVWYDGTRYHVVLSDWKGLAGGVNKAGLHYTSADGAEYDLVSREPIYTHSLDIDRNTIPLFRRERPQIVLDEKKQPIALCTSCLQREGESFIAVTPVKLY